MKAPKHSKTITTLMLAMILSGFAVAEDRIPKTSLEIIAQAQKDSTRPIIDHCIANTPEISDNLRDEYARYEQKIDLAMAPMLAREAAKPRRQESQTALAVLDAGLKAQTRVKLDKIQNADTTMYCRWLVKQLATVTVESFQEQIEAGVAKYRQVADTE